MLLVQSVFLWQMKNRLYGAGRYQHRVDLLTDSNKTDNDRMTDYYGVHTFADKNNWK